MTEGINGLNSIGPITPTPLMKGAAKTETVQGRDFKSVLFDSLEQVNKLQGEADQGVQRLITGESDNVAEVMAAVNKAGVAFDLLMQVRNQLTDAYREIQQMRI